MIVNWQKKRIAESRAYQLKAYEKVNELVFKERKGRFITLVNNAKLVDFISCSYLGLESHPCIVEAVIKHVDKYGLTFSAARTRIMSDSLCELDELLNKIFCGGFSTVFSSLHLAHLGFFPLLGSGELPSFPAGDNGFYFILDKKVHSSIQINRAMLSQFGVVNLIDSANLNDIRSCFEDAYYEKRAPVFISDSVGSMGGLAPIMKLVQLAERYNGYLYLDDAHGTSVFGRHGCGYVLDELEERFHPRLILTASLAKGFGTAGGGVLVLPTEEDALMVRRFASTYIFGGPPALPIVGASIASAKIHLSGELSSYQDSLQSNMSCFDACIPGNTLNRGSRSPIRGIIVGDEFMTIEYARRLQSNGFAVTAAMYPTVAKGKALLRIAISAEHTKEQIRALCESYLYVRDEVMHLSALF